MPIHAYAAEKVEFTYHYSSASSRGQRPGPSPSPAGAGQRPFQRWYEAMAVLSGFGAEATGAAVGAGRWIW